MTKPTISVVVPVWNEISHLPLTSTALEAAVRHYPSAELFFIDNGSDDGSFHWLKAYLTIGTVLTRPGLNVGAVRNEGARLSSGDIYCFVDADCLVPKNYLTTVSRTFSQTNCAVVGSTVKLPENPKWIEEVWYSLHHRPKAGPVNYINSGNLAIKASMFDTIGGFSEEIESGEDAELCQRVRSAGGTVYEEPRIEAIHLGNPKSMGEFFSQQLWHGIGMFGTVTKCQIDKPVAATATHIILVMLGVVYACLGGDIDPHRIGLLGFSGSVVPIVTIGYRFVRLENIVSPIRSFILYEAYFAARSIAFGIALWRLFWRK